jgi:putative membrane protein
MVATTHWLWHLPALEGASPVRRLFLSGFFYGMPLTNWLGWLLTGLIVARAMLAIVPPSRWAARVSPSRLPLVLYAANGVLPLLICAGRSMWWAVVLGALAMGVPLALAVRRPARARVAQREIPRVAGAAASG